MQDVERFLPVKLLDGPEGASEQRKPGEPPRTAASEGANLNTVHGVVAAHFRISQRNDADVVALPKPAHEREKRGDALVPLVSAEPGYDEADVHLRSPSSPVVDTT